MSEAKRVRARTAKPGPAARETQCGRLLTLARQRAGLSQAQLARRVGLTQDAIAHLERSRHLPELATAMEVAGALHTTVDALMGQPSGSTVVQYHTPGAVRVQVTNGGIVILGQDGPEAIEQLMASWERLREASADGTGPPGEGEGDGAA